MELHHWNICVGYPLALTRNGKGESPGPLIKDDNSLFTHILVSSSSCQFSFNISMLPYKFKI